MYDIRIYYRGLMKLINIFSGLISAMATQRRSNPIVSQSQLFHKQLITNKSCEIARASSSRFVCCIKALPLRRINICDSPNSGILYNPMLSSNSNQLGYIEKVYMAIRFLYYFHFIYACISSCIEYNYF